MLIAVTGSGGFLGGHLVEVLRTAGHDVRALVHRRPLEARDAPPTTRDALDAATDVANSVREASAGSAAPTVHAASTVRHLRGGLTSMRIEDIAAVGPAHFDGCDAVIHAAAFHGTRPEDGARMEHVNVDGTGAVLAAAQAAGVRRMVHVSTMGTCTPRADRAEATEADVVVPGARTSMYVRTKLAAERLALQAEGVEVVVVNPSALVGAGDTTPSVTGARILEVLRGRRPRVHEGPVNYVPAVDVAAGILQALLRGVARERYLLGGVNLDERGFLDHVCNAAACAVPERPRGSIVDRLLRRQNPIPGNLCINDTRAQRELGYMKTPLSTAFAHAIADYRTRNAV